MFVLACVLYQYLLFLLLAGCGVENSVEGSRILGGHETSPPHRFPWMVALIDDDNKLVGGGSLIGRQHILTAAHCCLERLRVLLGGHRMSTPGPAVAVRSCVRHPKYGGPGSTYEHDIAVLELVEPVTFHDLVSPLCIDLRPYPFLTNGTMLTAIGWGRVNEVSQPSDVLRVANVPLVDLEECRRKLSDTVVPKSNLCAGGNEQDTCQGDSGGPLMFHEPITRQWLQVGIVSWGIGCGRLGLPAIYTRVSEYLPFVWNATEGELCKKGDDTRHKLNESFSRPLRKPNLPECGIANRYGRIVGGSQVFPNKFPWLAAILFQNNLTGTGSYIGNGFVLTAAGALGKQLASHLDKINVLLGQHDWMHPEGFKTSFTVKHIVHHPAFVSGPQWDAALLQL
ncbi:trypsin 5G1-like isoform X2 [Ornithodoros turicata]|uniref:trypsin 5G1-like isoform X2 n=1 Tax=Ornithodoros turicata TaxID=34597 RepID=UPI0031389128